MRDSVKMYQHETSSIDYAAMGCVVRHEHYEYPTPRVHVCEECGKDFETVLPARHHCPECMTRPGFEKRWLERHPIRVVIPSLEELVISQKARTSV